MNRLLVLAVCASGLACTPSPNLSPYGNVNGSVEDQSGNTFVFGPAAEGDTIQSSGPNCVGTAQASTLLIALSSRAGFCADNQADRLLASNEAIVLSIVVTAPADGGAAPAIAPGLYTLGDGITDSSGNTYDVDVTFGIFDNACGQENLYATGGNIELDSFDGGEAVGEFGIAFNGNTSNDLTGSFDTLPCAFTAAQLCADGADAGCGQ